MSQHLQFFVDELKVLEDAKEKATEQKKYAESELCQERIARKNLEQDLSHEMNSHQTLELELKKQKNCSQMLERQVNIINHAVGNYINHLGFRYLMCINISHSIIYILLLLWLFFSTYIKPVEIVFHGILSEKPSFAADRLVYQFLENISNCFSFDSLIMHRLLV